MRRNIREHFDLMNPYHSLCREERNLCAVLYHLLLSEPENLSRFLKAVGLEKRKIKNPQIYVEYAHLRDLWFAFGNNRSQPFDKEKGEQNRIRREFILDALDLLSRNDLRELSIQEFNRLFVSRKSPSSSDIESPSNWSIKQLDTSFPDNDPDRDVFVRAARFKWCFNVKPDIVIFLSKNEVISIEAKLESSEGKYPAAGQEWKIFKDRKIAKVPQTEIQDLVFKLLGIQAQHVYLSKHGREKNGLAWSKLLEKMDYAQEPTFLKEQIERFQKR